MAAFSSVTSLKQYMIDEYYNGPPNPEAEQALILGFFDTKDYHLVLSILKKGCTITEEIKEKCLSSYDLRLYQCLYPNHLTLSSELMYNVCENGNLELIKWLRSKGGPWGEWTCALAAFEGNLELLQWLRSQGCPWDERTCSHAAIEGYLELIQWARSQGCPWDKGTCTNAAKGGHLKLLQWVRSHGCPWDEQTCSWAAWGGNLEFLQWARSDPLDPCPWDEWTCALAAENGHLELLQWSHSQGCPW